MLASKSVEARGGIRGIDGTRWRRLHGPLSLVHTVPEPMRLVSSYDFGARLHVLLSQTAVCWIIAVGGVGHDIPQLPAGTVHGSPLHRITEMGIGLEMGFDAHGFRVVSNYGRTTRTDRTYRY